MAEVMAMVTTYLVLNVFIHYCVNQHKKGERVL